MESPVFDLSIVTANLRIQCGSDGEHHFDKRIDNITAFFREKAYDVLCFQEVKPEGLAKLKEALPDYRFCAKARDVEEKDEAPVVAYRADRLECLDFSYAWLSPTPWQAGSRYPDQSICPRNYHLLTLQHKASGAVFYVLNTHFDHEGSMARSHAAFQLLDLCQDLTEEKAYPIFLCGDLNAEPDAPEIRLLDNTPGAEDGPGCLRNLLPDIPYTYHDFHPEREEGRCRIDYIFASPQVELLGEEISESYNGRLLSDHCFVAANCRLHPTA